MMQSEVRRMGSAKLQPRGQITIPAKIRRDFGWKPGDSVSFTATSEGVLELRVIKRRSLDELLEKYSAGGEAPDLGELRQVAAETMAREKLLDRDDR